MNRSWCVEVLNDLSDQVLCPPHLYCCANSTKDIIIINFKTRQHLRHVALRRSAANQRLPKPLVLQRLSGT